MNEDKATRYHRLKRRAELLGTAAAGAVLLVAAAHRRRRLTCANSRSVLGMIIGRGFEEAGTVAGGSPLRSLLLLHVVELPFAFYQGYVLEHRYGLSNEALGQWMARPVQRLARWPSSSARSAPRSCTGRFAAQPGVVVGDLRRGLRVLMIGIVQLAPVVLLPLFYPFKPLDRPALVERLMTLADRARTHIGGVYEWALSAHTKKANAALAGIGRTRRILLSDTLLADYSDDEIEVVLAHELSHHVHHDLWRGVALQTRCCSSASRRAPGAWRPSPTRLRLRGRGRSGRAAAAAAGVAARARSRSCRSPTRCRARTSGAPTATRST